MTATDFNQRTIDEFHAKQGHGVGPWGDNLLLMTSHGPVSGDQITTPLVSRRRDGQVVVVASKGGAPDDPQWYRNIQLNPEVVLEMATDGDAETFRATATVH